MLLDLSAPIRPGEGAAGIAIGQTVESLPSGARIEKLRRGSERHVYAAVTVWVADGMVTQVAVGGVYQGVLAGTRLGIGSTLAQVEAELGAVMEDEWDNLVVPGRDGWCFETTRWNGQELAENRESRITEIVVFPWQPAGG